MNYLPGIAQEINMLSPELPFAAFNRRHRNVECRRRLCFPAPRPILSHVQCTELTPIVVRTFELVTLYLQGWVQDHELIRNITRLQQQAVSKKI